jgi:PEP-CTERM motif
MKRLLLLIVAMILTAHAPVEAVPVSGNFQVGPFVDAFFITASGHLIGEGVDVNFGGDTGLVRSPVAPGQGIVIIGQFPADTTGGQATINGTTFNLCSTFISFICGSFSGAYGPAGGGISVIAPPIGPDMTASIAVPFHLTMVVFPPMPSITFTDLVGDGSAIVTLRQLSCGPIGGTCWELRDIQATFTVTPEPSTLLLVGSVLGAVYAFRRRV